MCIFLNNNFQKCSLGQLEAHCTCVCVCVFQPWVCKFYDVTRVIPSWPISVKREVSVKKVMDFSRMGEDKI